MKNGFFKVAAASPALRLADCVHNTERILSLMDQAQAAGVNLLVFPELSLTGCSCGDLFLQEALLETAEAQLVRILHHSAGKKLLCFVGLPLRKDGGLYNCAAAIFDGKLLALVPQCQPQRPFSPAPAENASLFLLGQEVPFGPRLLFSVPGTELRVAAEIGRDFFSPVPPSAAHCLAGATVIASLFSEPETVAGPEYRRGLLSAHTARCAAAYLLSAAGPGESTADGVYAGHSLIYENGLLLAESAPFSQTELLITEVDVARLSHARRQAGGFSQEKKDYLSISFSLPLEETQLTRFIDPAPFIPAQPEARAARCQAILDIQSSGLARRLAHTGAKCAVIGVSGGLDSTLALLAAARAMDRLGRPRGNILAVTMPCFGTTARTRGNAELLCERLGASLRCIDIKAAVDLHFSDIGHEKQHYDVTYENSQARERTQVLMDLANKHGGIVVGTGDLSELALGWATYNGDHMSMYGVNAAVPKTLIRHVVRYYADSCGDETLAKTLLDVLDTPVSPELLPAENGRIAQKTEDLVGPYELHDFYLYHLARWGASPQKIYRLACRAFQGQYDPEVILKWLKTFCRRFFNQQFKRSCLPDGPKVGSVSLSPRGDWQMPSDASSALWLEALEV